MPNSLEDFGLLNTASQLRRAGEHAFAYYRGAIAREECDQVVQESYDLLAKTARVTHHLVPLAEQWGIARLRRMAVLDRRFVATMPEVLFIDRDDSSLAPMAAGLLGSYARGRVQASSAGLSPAEAVSVLAIQAMAQADIDIAETFCKPVTEDAVRAADVVVLLGDLPPDLGVVVRLGGDRIQRWEVSRVADGSEEFLQMTRNELDRRVLRLLADVLTPDRP
jgi:ArsR family transcriptional regulator